MDQESYDQGQKDMAEMMLVNLRQDIRLGKSLEAAVKELSQKVAALREARR